MKFFKKITIIFTILVLFNLVNFSQVIKTSSVELKGYKKYSATAYCLRGKTASGQYVRNGIIAVDPRIIKLGSSVDIFGMGIFKALDTGGAIKGNKIDIWMSCSNAKRFGRKSVFIKVYD